MLNKHSDLSPPLRLIADDVFTKEDYHGVLPARVSEHWLTRGLNGGIAIYYRTLWDEPKRGTWEAERELEQFWERGDEVWDEGKKESRRRRRAVSSRRIGLPLEPKEKDTSLRVMNCVVTLGETPDCMIKR